jgi:hypothetical protein
VGLELEQAAFNEVSRSSTSARNVATSSGVVLPSLHGRRPVTTSGNCSIVERSSAASTLSSAAAAALCFEPTAYWPGHVGDLRHGATRPGRRPTAAAGGDRDLLGGGRRLVDHARDPLEGVDDVAGEPGAGVHLLGALLGGEDGRVRLRLDLRDDRLDLAGRLLRALGELADLGRDDGEAAAVLAARRASIAALSASRFVWSARSSMTSRIRPIS